MTSISVVSLVLLCLTSLSALAFNVFQHLAAPDQDIVKIIGLIVLVCLGTAPVLRLEMPMGLNAASALAST